jgi:hypothetical protein
VKHGIRTSYAYGKWVGESVIGGRIVWTGPQRESRADAQRDVVEFDRDAQRKEEFVERLALSAANDQLARARARA